MANAVTKIRTNFVEVADLEKFKEIISYCVADGDAVVEIITDTDVDGNTKYGFCCTENILGIRMTFGHCGVKSCCNCPEYGFCESDFDYDMFLRELQQVIAPDDALIVTTVCYENLRFIHAYAEIVTCNAIEGLNLDTLAFDKACEMLGNKDWNTVNVCGDDLS